MSQLNELTRVHEVTKRNKNWIIAFFGLGSQFDSINFIFLN